MLGCVIEFDDVVQSLKYHTSCWHGACPLWVEASRMSISPESDACLKLALLGRSLFDRFWRWSSHDAGASVAARLPGRGESLAGFYGTKRSQINNDVNNVLLLHRLLNVAAPDGIQHR